MKFPDWLPVYGDLKYRGDSPMESVEQITFFAKLRRLYPDTYGLTAIHPRNEGKRHHGQTLKQKLEGMSPGASDIVIPGSPSFVCELKRQNHVKSTWQKGQIDYLAACRKQGAFVCVALGHDAAWEAFEEWQKKYGIE